MRLAALALALAIGCGSAPDNPTWTEDIKPIYHANCARCHGPILRNGAPVTLAGYENASGLGGFALIRIEAGEMPPPPARLSDVQIETIANWVADGTPLGEPVGEPPAMEILEPPGIDANGILRFEYLITDPDFDVVTGFLYATIDGTQDQVDVILTSGRATVELDVSDLSPGAVVVLTAALADGGGQLQGGQIVDGVEVDVGAVTVSSAATGGSE